MVLLSFLGIIHLFIVKKAIVKAFQVVFPDIKGAYEKLRFADSQLESQYLFGEEAQEPLLVMENGVTYATYLNEGLMTGIFLTKKCPWSACQWPCGWQNFVEYV